MTTLSENPARFHPNIIEALRVLIPATTPKPTLIFDPFAGDGRRLGELCDQLGYRFQGGDLVDWKGRDDRVIWRDATVKSWYPPRVTQARWMVVTSPTYNNGINDHFEPKDSSTRTTYRVAAGHPLTDNNTGRWSGRGSAKAEKEYWRLHELAVAHWPDRAIVNVKNSIRDQQTYDLVGKWVQLLAEAGYPIISQHSVNCPGNRRGQNGQARFDVEWLLVAGKDKALPSRQGA